MIIYVENSLFLFFIDVLALCEVFFLRRGLWGLSNSENLSFLLFSEYLFLTSIADKLELKTRDRYWDLDFKCLLEVSKGL